MKLRGGHPVGKAPHSPKSQTLTPLIVSRGQLTRRLSGSFVINAPREIITTPMIPKGVKAVQRIVNSIHWLATHKLIPYRFGAWLVSKITPFLIRKLVK